EGFQAYERLCELARTLGLDARYEVIPPPGMVDLNRDNLVVICGPRLSPIIAQVLASDPNLGFAHDDHGWYLADHAPRTPHRPPPDPPPPGRPTGPPAPTPSRPTTPTSADCPASTAKAPSCTSPASTPPATAAPCTTWKGTWRGYTQR